jgi:hypothetical protein
MIEFLNKLVFSGLIIAAIVVGLMFLRITILPMMVFFLDKGQVTKGGKLPRTSTTVKLNAHDYDEDY